MENTNKNKINPKVLAIAIACHQANLGWCVANGDFSQKNWDDAELWQRESALKGVEFRLNNPLSGPDAQHNSWMQEKIDQGWVYGEVKDADKKTHPCIVPFSDLPEFQQKKDKLFSATVDALKGSYLAENLTFEQAAEFLHQGEYIALPEWKGFWFQNVITQQTLVLTSEGEIHDTPFEEYKSCQDWKVVEASQVQQNLIIQYLKIKRVLTFGEKLVGLNFNPSGDDQVGKVKQKFANILDAIGDPTTDTEKRSYSYNIIRTQAINITMLAQMAVVKFLTWNE